MGLRSDQTIRLTGPKTARSYPDPPRRIHYFDVEKNSRLIFLTNNFLFPALTIAQLYRARWQVEWFFRWIKQHLRSKAFLWNFRERRKDPSLGGDLRLRARGHRK
jgi:IS4 transposase